MSEYRAHAQWDLLRRKLTMYVGRDNLDGVTTFVSPTGDATDVTPGQDPPEGFAWTIPNGSAHAIIAALSRELGLSDTAAHMRADLLAERERCDKLIDALILRGETK
jgi:hypothetical protein